MLPCLPARLGAGARFKESSCLESSVVGKCKKRRHRVQPSPCADFNLLLPCQRFSCLALQWSCQVSVSHELKFLCLTPCVCFRLLAQGWHVSSLDVFACARITKEPKPCSCRLPRWQRQGNANQHNTTNCKPYETLRFVWGKQNSTAGHRRSFHRQDRFVRLSQSPRVGEVLVGSYLISPLFMSAAGSPLYFPSKQVKAPVHFRSGRRDGPDGTGMR